MSAAPFDVRPLIARLRASVPALRQVAGAADLAAIRALADFPAPCAYVILAREGYEPTRTGYSPRGEQVSIAQAGPVTFAVVLAVRNYREERGVQGVSELDTLLRATRSALLGYVPDSSGARPCQLKQGEVTSYDAATLLWTDLWQTHHSIASEANP